MTCGTSLALVAQVTSVQDVQSLRVVAVLRCTRHTSTPSLRNVRWPHLPQVCVRAHSTPHCLCTIRRGRVALLLQKNYVQQAICAVSRTSVLTGRRPDTTQVWDLYSYWRELGNNYTTIPEYFKAHGYEAVGMGKVRSTKLSVNALLGGTAAHLLSASSSVRCNLCA